MVIKNFFGKKNNINKKYWSVTQLVEWRTVNSQVVGPSPTRPANPYSPAVEAVDLKFTKRWFKSNYGY